jgi:hypothetical protein
MRWGTQLGTNLIDIANSVFADQSEDYLFVGGSTSGSFTTVIPASLTFLNYSIKGYGRNQSYKLEANQYETIVASSCQFYGGSSSGYTLFQLWDEAETALLASDWGTCLSGSQLVYEVPYHAGSISSSFVLVLSCLYDACSANLTVSIYGAGTNNYRGTDIAISKLNSSSGNVLWSYQYGTTSDDVLTSMCQSSFDNESFIAVGYTYGLLFGARLNGDSDIFLSRNHISNGSVLWGVQIGGGDENYAMSVACDAVGHVFVVGYNYGGRLFNQSKNPLLGNYDMFTAKYNSSGMNIISPVLFCFVTVLFS